MYYLLFLLLFQVIDGLPCWSPFITSVCAASFCTLFLQPSRQWKAVLNPPGWNSTGSAKTSHCHRGEEAGGRRWAACPLELPRWGTADRGWLRSADRGDGDPHGGPVERRGWPSEMEDQEEAVVSVRACRGSCYGEGWRPVTSGGIEASACLTTDLWVQGGLGVLWEWSLARSRKEGLEKCRGCPHLNHAPKPWGSQR